MPSKGIEAFACVSVSGGTVTFTAPDTPPTQYTMDSSSAPAIRHGNIQIDESDIGLLDHWGQFAWTAVVNSQTVGSQFWDISPLTGSMSTGSGGPFDLKSQTSSCNSTNNWGLSYGFYDSGDGYTGLTNQDQAWVYLTPNVSNWMRRLVRQYPSIGNAPFCSFVLPGAHDAGSYDVSAIEGLTDLATVLAQMVTAVGLGPLSIVCPYLPAILSALEGATNEILQKALQNFSMTQANNVTLMLDMGVRYFDFRPGYCVTVLSSLLTDIYHQHGFIPGATYQSFLEQLFVWLATNPNEIVVVSANFQGFVQSSMQPSIATLENIVTVAQSAAAQTVSAASAIQLGGPQNLSNTYNQLISSNTRLIFLNQIDPAAPLHSSNNTVKYDSYSPTAYATITVGPILQALAAMNTAGQVGADYTVLQLQGTASTASGVAEAVMTDDSWSGSPLMMTKPSFDCATYPWVAANLRTNLGSDQLIVLLNDFADNALAVYASAIMAAGASS